MLRRRIALVCAVMLLFMSGAMAQSTTMEEYIEIGGVEETRTVTLFESLYGYTLWYEADKIAYIAPQGETNIDRFELVNHSNQEEISLEISLSGRPEDALSSDTLDAQREDMKSNGYTIIKKTSDTVTGIKNDEFLVVRLVESERGLYFLSARYPSAAEENWGVRLNAMMDSFLPQPALRLSYGYDVQFVSEKASLNLDEDAPSTILWADEPVSRITLYHARYDGTAYQKGEQYLSLNGLKAMTEGIGLKAAFVTTPTIYVEYTDSLGDQHSALLCLAEDETRLMVMPILL